MNILLQPVLVIEHVPAMTMKLFAGDVNVAPPPEIVTFDAEVILPFASTVITGTIVALPYVVATTPVDARVAASDNKVLLAVNTAFAVPVASPDSIIFAAGRLPIPS